MSALLHLENARRHHLVMAKKAEDLMEHHLEQAARIRQTLQRVEDYRSDSPSSPTDPPSSTSPTPGDDSPA